MAAKKDLESRPVVLDLFAGIGGGAVGFEGAGMEIKYAVEIDPIQAAVHKYNFPNCQIFCQDIRTFSGSAISEPIDLIVSGSPCQSFSAIGKRDPQDPRGKLIYEFSRLLGEIRPKYAIFENVPMLAGDANWKVLHDFIIQIEQHGYRVVKPWKILDGSHYGGVQRRKRLFLLIYRLDVTPLEYPQLEISSLRVGSVLKDLEVIEPYFKNDLGVERDKLSDPYLYPFSHRRATGDRLYGHLCSQHSSIVASRFARTKQGKSEPVSHFHKLDYTGLALTIRAGTSSANGAHTSPRHIHYSHNRCISIREASLLQSFPLWYAHHRKIWHGHRGIGNSIMPCVALAIGREVVKSLGVNLSRIKLDDLGSSDPALLGFNREQAQKFFSRARQQKEISVASLFSGCGGMDLACEQTRRSFS